MPERQLQEWVRQACTMNVWLYYHTHRSQHSPAGFVDTVAVRDTRLVCAELKRRGQKPTPAQQQWLGALAQVRSVEVYCWTEDDLPTLLKNVAGDPSLQWREESDWHRRCHASNFCGLSRLILDILAVLYGSFFIE